MLNLFRNPRSSGRGGCQRLIIMLALLYDRYYTEAMKARFERIKLNPGHINIMVASKSRVVGHSTAKKS